MVYITNSDWRALEIADKANRDIVKKEISTMSSMMVSTRHKRVRTTGGTRTHDHRGRMTTVQ